MAGCGYVCPVCEGSGHDDEGVECTWCTPVKHYRHSGKDPEFPSNDMSKPLDADENNLAHISENPQS